MPTQRVAWTFFATDKYSRIAKKIAARTDLVKRKFKQLNDITKRTSQSLKKMGQSLKKLSLVASAAVIGSLKAFSDMESGVTNVLTLLDDKEVEKFGGAIEKLATESLTKFGFNTEETTRALFNNVSALGTGEKSLEAFAAAQKLAIGGVTTLDTSVSGIAAIMNAYGDAAQNSTDIANAFFASQKKGTVTVAQLADNVGRVAPIAKNLGIGYRELLATMSQLTQGGLNIEESTTALRGVFSSLQRPTDQAAAQFTQLGIPFGVTAVRGAGLAKTLQKIAEVSKKQPDILAQLIPNVRALTGVASLGAKEVARIQEIVGSMNQDQLSPAFQKQMETFSRSTKVLKGNLVAMGVTIGANLAPAFLWLGEKLKSVTEWFQGLSDRTKKWISWGLVAVAVLSSLFIAAAAVVAFFGAAFAAVASAVFTLPVAIGIAIVAAVAAIGAAIWSVWDDLVEVARGVKDFFGFGDEMNLTGSAEINKNSRIEGEIVVRPKEMVEKVKLKTTGDTSGLKLGMNMADQT